MIIIVVQNYNFYYYFFFSINIFDDRLQSGAYKNEKNFYTMSSVLKEIKINKISIRDELYIFRDKENGIFQKKD